jgi:threonine-phosphate decarboxylase
VIEPAFVEYRLNANKRRIPVDTIITRWEDGFVPEPEEVCRLIRQVDLLFVGLPNNPSGHLLPGKLLERMAEEAQASATWLAVDEAFISLVTNGEERSLIQKIARFPRVIVLRSLTKLFALPGLRLGYVVAEPGLINRLKRMQVSWSVNGLAQRVGWVVAEPHFYAAYVKEAQTWLVRERWDLREALARAFPVRIFPGEANYLLVRIEDGRWTAWRLQQALGERGFLIRDCSMYPGLDKRYFRIAVKRRAENEALVKALADVWDKEG